MTAKSRRVLVLDDNVDVACSVRDILEMCDHEVVVVHDGPAAVAAYLSAEFDIALFDIRMPGMNGVEAFLTILEERPDACVVFMSGYADKDLVETGMKSGAKGFLSKPFDPDIMIELVTNVVADGLPTAA